MTRIFLFFAAALVLAACSGRDEPKELMNLRADGPDEFAVTTNQPLEIPEDIASRGLPEPGGTSRTTITSQDQIASALGGGPNRGFNDQAFVNSASRFGVSQEIRTVLAEEDEEIRSRVFVRPLERLARKNVYFDVYDDQSVDAYAELDRLRRSGVRTPTAPPQSED